MTVTKSGFNEGVRSGDIATLKNRADLMTVEAVRQETFGIVLDCIWFDSDDCLRYRRYPLHNLDLFPRHAMAQTIKPGMDIRLRSRGPVMTVRRLFKRNGQGLAECVWTGAMGLERKRAFPVECLVLTILERFETADGQSL